MNDFADKVSRESFSVGDVRRMLGLEKAAEAVPGAKLISGCIALRQSAESFVEELYDELSQLHLDIHRGLATIGQAEESNAASIDQYGCR